MEHLQRGDDFAICLHTAAPRETCLGLTVFAGTSIRWWTYKFGCERQVCGQCGQYLGVTYSKEHRLGCRLLPFQLLIDFCWSDGPTKDSNQLLFC